MTDSRERLLGILAILAAIACAFFVVLSLAGKGTGNGLVALICAVFVIVLMAAKRRF